MVISILKWVAAGMILSLIALFFWQGGYWKIAKYAEIIPNPLTDATSTDLSVLLPGQPDFWEVPDTTSAPEEHEYGMSDYENPTDALYDENATGPQPQTGGRSPYASFVTLQAGNVQTDNPRDEYILIRAAATLSSPINIAGWSLQSALTGERAVLPLAASPFIQGRINQVRSIALESTGYVVVSSGPSPVGVSFRETGCTGYLAQTQSFVPPLANACSRPTELLPRTQQNETQYGANCIDYIERLPHCTYPINPPAQLSSACRTYITNTFTYNGCVQAYAGRNNLNAWRAYLASERELWRNSHDVIRLLDSEGRTVDTLSF